MDKKAESFASGNHALPGETHEKSHGRKGAASSSRTSRKASAHGPEKSTAEVLSSSGNAKKDDTRYMALVGKLICIAKKHNRSIDRYVTGHNMQHRQHRLLVTLSHLSENGEHVSQKALADKLNVTPAAVAVTLKKLEKDGVVEKKVNEKDNRYNTVTLTEKGARIVQDSGKAFRTIDRRMFEGFTEEELTGLSSYLDRVENNLSSVDV